MLLDKLKKVNTKVLLAIMHQLLMAFYGFGLLLVLYRITSKEETGRWLLFTSAISLMDMFMHGFLQTPIIRKITTEKSNKESIDAIASNAFFFSIGIWAILSTVVLTASFIFSGSQIFQDLRWYPLFGSAMILYNLCWWVSNALSDFKSVLIQRIIFCAVSVSLVVTFYVQFRVIKVEYLIISQLVAYVISSFSSILFIRAIQISPRYFSRSHIDFYFSYGKFTSGSMIMGSLFRNADIFMIASFLNQGAVAVYSVAQKMVEIFEVALRGMASHALPEFCQCSDNYNLMMKKYIKTTSLLFVFFLPAALIVFIFSESFIQLFSGTGYSGASIVLKFFMIYVLFLILDRMTGVMLEAFGLAKYNLIKTGILLFINITGNAIALLYFNSLAGVAAVSIVAAIVSVLTGFYFIHQQTGVSFSQKQFLAGVNYMIK